MLRNKQRKRNIAITVVTALVLVAAGTALADVDPRAAKNPDPPNGAGYIEQTAVLIWETIVESPTFDVYFGTTSPPPLVSAGQIAANYDPPGDMPLDTTYYWKVDIPDVLFDIVYDEANASKWFGGDDRDYPDGVKGRNVGVGQSFHFDETTVLDTFGFRFTSRFDYSQDPQGFGHAVDLVLHIRDENGNIIAQRETYVPDTFSGGWVHFDISLTFQADTTYIFTCYLKDGATNMLTTGVHGHQSNVIPNSVGYSGQNYSGHIDQWSDWLVHPWDFNISLQGAETIGGEQWIFTTGSIDPDIDVLPITLDFGKVDLDTSSTATVTLSNEGPADLTVTDIALQPGGSSDFSITFAPELPATIATGQTAEIDITYAPLAVDCSSGVLEVTSDDPDEPVVEVVLEGAGVVVDEKYTPPGKQVIVELEDERKAKKKLKVEYDEVRVPGITRMVIKKPKAEEALPEDYKLGDPAELLELETTAEIEGEVTVYIDYSDTDYEGSEYRLKMHHKSADEPWKDITLLVDTEVKEVVGKTDSFSDFGIFEVDAFGLINGLINEVLMLNLQQGISNSLDAKLGAALQAVDDFNAYNDIAAVNTLEAFINAVEAQSGNKIPEADADALIAAAQEVIAILSSE